MYILIALASLLLEACAEAIDKIAIVRDKAIDIFAASFLRNFAYFLWIGVFVATGLFGRFVFLINWPVILLGVIFTGSAFFFLHLSAQKDRGNERSGALVREPCALSHHRCRTP